MQEKNVREIQSLPDFLETSCRHFYQKNSIRNFFREAWEASTSTSSYKVFLAQRCLNLNEIYFREWVGLLRAFLPSQSFVKNFENEYNTVFLSQYAWLLKADEMMEYYVKNGAFPKSYVYDELLINGFDVGDVISKMLSALWEAYQKKHWLSESTRQQIRTDFFNSLDIHVYAMSRKESLLEPDILSGVKYVQHYDTNSNYLYINEIVNKLSSNTDVKNTAFMPTFWVKQETIDRLRSDKNLSAWKIDKCRYEGQETEIWQRSVFPSNGSVRLHECFCLNYCENEKTYSVTPYFICGAVSEKELDKFFGRLQTIFQQTQNTVFLQFIYILSLDHSWATNQKLQLCLAILSILRFNEFLSPVCEMHNAVEYNDLKKISLSFGTVSETFPAFDFLCRDTIDSRALKTQLDDAIISFFYNMAKPIDFCDYDDVSPNHDLMRYIDKAEDYFISLEYSQRKKVQKFKRNAEQDTLQNTYRKDSGMSDYFLHFCRYDDYDSFYEKVAAFFVLVHCGIVGYKVHYSKEGFIYQKAGESTGLIAVKRYKDFIPALIQLEHFCKRVHFSVPFWAKRFGSYLGRKGYGENLEADFEQFAEGTLQGGMELMDYQKVCISWNLENGNTDGISITQKVHLEELKDFLNND